MNTTTTITEARIYVGTYGKYNNGSIKGAWLTLSDYADREDFLAAALELHSDESDPELMFQDFEGFPHAWYSEGSAPDDILWEWLALDENDQLAFGLYADNIGGQVTVDDFRDVYQGSAESEADFAETIATDNGEIPDNLPSWIVIDWQASWDCNLRHDYWTERDTEGTLHIYRNA